MAGLETGAYTNTDLNTGRAKRSLGDFVAAPGLWINRVAAGKIFSFQAGQRAGMVPARRFPARRRQERPAQFHENLWENFRRRREPVQAAIR